MKLSGRVFTLTFLLFTIAMFENQASAQCYGCGVNPITGCAKCEDHGPGGPGYEVCGLINCSACHLKFICDQRAQVAQRVPAVALKFDEATIRRIAGINPRYAATLAQINRMGGLTDPVRFTWSAAELTSKDVEWWLKSEKESEAFFNDFAEKARKANKSGLPQLIYDVAAMVRDDATLATVVINVIQGAPADYRFSNLQLTFANVGGAEPDKEQWVAVDWRIDKIKRSKGGEVRTSIR